MMKYNLTKRKLKKHFIPKKNKQHGRYVFGKMRINKNLNKTMNQYTAKFKEKANYCEFGDLADERICQYITQTIDNEELITRLIQEKWTLTRFLEEVKQKHNLQYKVKDIIIDNHLTR